MQRWFRLSALVLACILSASISFAQKPLVQVSGRLGPNEVRIFLQDAIYQINGTYMIAGTLIIEPGTEVVFLDNGRIIDSVGGRIIADGRMAATYNGTNPASLGLLQYNDPRYFLSSSVVSEQSINEPTVDPAKYDYIFNVVLDTATKTLSNLIGPSSQSQNPNRVRISPMRAIMWTAARLSSDDDIIRFQQWRRLYGVTPSVPVNLGNRRIVFRGQPINDYSREWGHIIVLPGARAAFFRDCDFRDFRKDTTVDNRPIYDTARLVQSEKLRYMKLNLTMNRLTNGAGGALTSFASRTWLLDCNFRNNMARYRAGALQLLQSPLPDSADIISAYRVYPDTAGLEIGYYPWVDKNPNLTEADGTPIQQSVVQLDELDRTVSEPAVANDDSRRQLVDDARLAIFAGRVRRLTFENNKTLLSAVDTLRIGGNRVLTDTNKPYGLFDDTKSWKNESFGGAVLISGRELDENRKIEIGLGINDSIRVANGPFGFRSFGAKDFVAFNNNTAINRQLHPNSRGARGGALFIGNYTSMIINGSFRNNSTQTPYQGQYNIDRYSLGGAIYHAQTLGRLQLRGHPTLATEFINNSAGSGGAVYIHGNTDPRPSPIIGGSDVPNPRLRDYGRKISFEDNRADAHGGAIYTNRNMTVYGAGGFINDLPLAQAYGPGFAVRFTNNSAGYSGGAIAIHLPSIEPPVPIEQRYVRFVRAEFKNNTVGSIPATASLEVRKSIRGGGAVYSMNADLNVVKGCEFNGNRALNSNGGAIAMIHPRTSSKRFFVTDADGISILPNGVATDFTTTDSLFTNQRVTAVAADVRMLTRFYNNVAEPNPDLNLLGSGTTQMGLNKIDILRFHPGFIRDVLGNGMRENGVGLGGAIYILDSVTQERRNRRDSVFFNRVRIQNNTAFTGAAVYSDNFDLSLVMFRSLITSNKATSPIGRTQDFIKGPYIKPDNPASSDLAGAVIYGEFAGPLPWSRYSVAANSIYDNDARFIVRLPDAADSKGTLSGGAGIGKGTTVSMMGNYWGKTEANVNTIMPNNQGPNAGQSQETFFLQGNGKTHMRFIRNAAQRTSPTQQGPFEQNGFPGYNYSPIQVGLIPDTLLMEGRIYDLFDKGTDIKTADYSNRRMSPIEDFAVGIPPKLRKYQDVAKQSWGKYVRRTTRDPNHTDSLNYVTGLENNLWRQIGRLQGEFALDQRVGEYTHPIGYPLFLETKAQYDGEDPNLNNDDNYSLNESAFFVINDSTGDYIRVNLRQLTDIQVQNNLGEYPREIFRGRVDFVMDSAARTGVSARVRRTYEGLYNFGGSESLLPRLADSAVNEDISALGGRRYELVMSPELNRRGIRYNYQNQAVVYSNRPKMPATLAGGVNNADTIVSYFAGERWNALPVRPGDYIRVISRTALWKEGVDSAIQRGLGFRISNSTPPPVFTGSKIQTENPKVSDIYKSTFKDKITLNEDVSYNRPDDSDPRTRDSIFVITAIDSNMFYDPRWALGLFSKPGDSTYMFYNQLEYFWYPLYVSPFGDTIRDTDPTNKLTGLRRWVKADTIWPSMTPNPYYGATGYVVLKGKPTNPYVVPGGEWMEVVAKNYSPAVRTVDALKNIRGKTIDSLFIADTLSKFVYLYQSYFHAQQYDDVILSQPGNARYLNQDTLSYGNSDSVRYKFMIFVADSIPQFTQSTGKSEGCNPPEPGTLVANVTDKLRFQVDFDTDDEIEDRDAETLENWDFRYGRTSYGFLSKSIRTNPADTSNDELYQVRPNWMSDNFMYKDSSDTQTDPLAVDFTTKGMLNVRIPRTTAINLLTPAFSGDRAHRALNVDTIITLVVNDGHSGVNYQTRKVFVNVSPEITTQTLPKAKEGTDYNPTLLDRDRRITYYDPNFGQAQNFKLLYADSPEDSIVKDPCFLEAGYWNVKDLKKTPKWLQINPVSGALYGTPGVKDAPRKINPYNNPDTVTVVLTDAGGLTDVKTFILEVDSLNHVPRLLSAPVVRCVADGDPYTDTLFAEDIDLLRDMPIAGRETITLSVFSPAGINLELDPSTITGPKDSVQKIVIRATGGKIDLKNLPTGTIVDGKLKIRIQVTDGEETKFLDYTITVSDPTDFTVPITVRNNELLGGLQVLTFGTAKNATVGEFGGIQEAKLDANYCEFELPPLPPKDAFDARWTIAKTNGIIRNIFPTAVAKDASVAIYKARFQAGQLTGSGTAAYPVELTWNTDDVPATSDLIKNPAGSSWHIRDAVAAGAHFDYNMKLATGRHAATCDFQKTGSVCTITIYQDIIDGFIIYYDFVSDVSEPVPGFPTAVSISENTPNPFNASTQFSIAIPATANVKVGMYDALGNLVKVIANDVYQPGNYTLTWDGKGLKGEDLSAGVYLCKMSVNGTNIARPMMLVR